MRVRVLEISIPAWSTIGFGRGVTEKGDYVTFRGDHRPMRTIGEALQVTQESVEADIDDYQIVDFERGN